MTNGGGAGSDHKIFGGFPLFRNDPQASTVDRSGDETRIGGDGGGE